MEQRRIIGILGGKGPEATIELMRLILKHTPAATEEEHLRVVVDNNPRIPKPSLAITGQGPNPVPALVAAARNLERAGADFFVVPCNSAHYYADALRAAVSIPLVSIIDETVCAIRASHLARVGLLATSGLLSSGIYQRGLEASGVAVLAPEAAEQAELMRCILGYKDEGALRPLTDHLLLLCANMVRRGAEGLVLACTEIPIALQGHVPPVVAFDTLDILARACVREAGMIS